MKKQNTNNIVHTISHTKPSLIIPLEIGLGILFSIVSFLIFIKITTEVVEKEAMVFDTLISTIIYSLRTPTLTKIMQFITVLGGEFLVIASIGTVLLFLWKNRRREALLFSFTIIIGYLLNASLKYFLQIPRPDIDPIYIAHFYSFPSGHAMNSFIFYATLAYFFFQFTRNKLLSLLICLCAAILVLLIGFSRVYLGVHYPSDILAGFIAGFWLVITVILIDKTMNYYKLLRNKN